MLTDVSGRYMSSEYGQPTSITGLVGISGQEPRRCGDKKRGSISSSALPMVFVWGS